MRVSFNAEGFDKSEPLDPGNEDMSPQDLAEALAEHWYMNQPPQDAAPRETKVRVNIWDGNGSLISSRLVTVHEELLYGDTTVITVEKLG